MTAITPFEFPATGAQVRVVEIDGEPWFVAADVTAILGYADGRHAVNALPERMRSSVSISHGTPGNPNRSIVSEPGVYRLTMRSTLPEAEAFQDWLAEDVLPTLRRTGSYSVAPRFAVPTSFAEALELAARQARELDAERAKVAELEPHAAVSQRLLSAEGDYSVGDAAKVLGRDPAITTGRNRLFGILHELGWAYVQRADHRYRAAQYAIERRWLSELPSSHYHPRTGELVLDPPQVRVTHKGLVELHRRLGGTSPLVAAQQLAITS